MHRTPSLLRAALPIAAVLACSLGACQMFDEEGNEVRESTYKSEPSDYYYNAQQYYTGGEYERAKDQWTRYLESDPEDFNARAGVAFCDYWIGIRALARGDISRGRSLLEASETAFKTLWDGRLEETTAGSTEQTEAQWRAALGLALARRGLGEADDQFAKNRRMAAESLAMDDPEREKGVKAAAAMRERRDRNWQASLSILEKLAAMQDASPDAIVNLAELYVLLDRWDDAEREFLRYLALAESTLAARRELFAKLPEQYKDERSLSIATQELERIIESNVDKQVNVLVTLGGIFWEKGDYGRSLDHLARAHDLRPERLDLLVKMAQCEGNLKEYAHAVELLDDFIRKNAERDSQWTGTRDLSQAYRLKAEYEMKMDRMP